MHLKIDSKPALTPRGAPYQVTMKSGKVYLYTQVRSVPLDLNIDDIASIWQRVLKRPYDANKLRKMHLRKR